MADDVARELHDDGIAPERENVGTDQQDGETGQVLDKNEDAGLVVRYLNSAIVTCSAPGNYMGVRIGFRTTIVSLPSGGVVVLAPGPTTPAIDEAIAARGNNVRYIVVMNAGPHTWLAKWKQLHPNAAIIAPQGITERPQPNTGGRGVEIAHTVTPGEWNSYSVTPAFDAVLSIIFVHAHPDSEMAVLHKPTGTLIVGRLIFNLPAKEQYTTQDGKIKLPALSRALAPAMSTSAKRGFLQRVYQWYMSTRKNRREFETAIAAIDQWNFDTIIPCHGDTITTGGKEVFRGVFRYVLPRRG